MATSLRIIRLISGRPALDFLSDPDDPAPRADELDHPARAVTIVPLVPTTFLPQPASAQTRAAIPSGYGVQEQCLPFTAASALGFVIPSPIGFGLCAPSELPPGCRAFRSPLDRPAADGRFADPRVFYVVDNPDSRFVGNAYDSSASSTAR